MDLPSNVSTCGVSLRLVQAVADDSDPGVEPQAIALAGATVTFTASVSYCRNATTAPPALIALAPVACTFDSTGQMIGPDGSQGVRLVASDDPDLNPTGWTYTARVKHPSISGIVVTFVAPSGGQIDLATVVPVPPNPGSELLAWESAVATAAAAQAAAEAAIAEVADRFGPGIASGAIDADGNLVLTLDNSATLAPIILPPVVGLTIDGGGDYTPGAGTTYALTPDADGDYTMREIV